MAEIANSIVAKIGEYLVAPIGCQIGYLFCYKNNVANLRREVESLKKVRSDVEGVVGARKRKGDVIMSNVAEWLKTTSQIEEESNKFLADEANSNMRCFKGICPNLIQCYQQSRKAMKKATMANTLYHEGRNFGDTVSYPAPPPTIGSTSSEDVKEVLDSRELMCERVIEALKDDKVHMIGIYGTGGIGKTTLVKEVGKRVQAEKLFDVVAIAIVSQTLDLKRMQGEIADPLDLKFEDESILGRAHRLSQQIKETKRILIILDDIWEKLELEDVGIPFGSNHRGCKILLTSRIMDVCNQMRSQRNIEIAVLSATESFTLFKKMAGDCMEHVDIQPIAGEVVRECGGLPLAIVTVASTLKDKPLEVWKDAARRLKKSILSEKVISSLKLSYDYLHSNETQSFFLLCCLFPEDSNISIENLCRYGMGLRLFRDIENVSGARDRAHALSSNLKSSCLLLEGTNTCEVKMHNVVRHFAISTASEGEHVFLVKHAIRGKELPEQAIGQRYTSISLSSEDIVELPHELKCPKLEILLLEFSNSSFEIPSNFFQESTELKVLSMQNMKFLQLPPSLKYLKNLESLCLDNTTLGDISVIGELKKLKILSFVWSEIKVLPEEIGKLVNLRLLDLNYCNNLERIAPGAIKGLSKLEELHMRNKFDGWEIGGQESERNNASTEELKSLSQLTHLEIWIPDDKYFPTDLVFTNLSSYYIRIGKERFEKFDKYVPNSKRLDIIQSTSALSKDGVNMLLNTCEYLDLSGMEGLPNILSDISRRVFLNLKSLTVLACGDVKFISKTMDNNLPDVFPVLEELYLEDLDNLIEIRLGKNLKHLMVTSCDRLKSIFTHCTDRDFLKLLTLAMEGCEMMEIMKGEENAKIKEYVAFPNLERLKLEDLPNLTCLYSNMNTSTSLDTLFAEEQMCKGRITKMSILQDSLTALFPSSMLLMLYNLKYLTMGHCDSVESLFELKGPQETYLLPNLQDLYLMNLPKLDRIFMDYVHSHQLVCFQNLREIRIDKCNKLRNLFTRSMAYSIVQLNFLKIESCDLIHVIIEEDIQDDTSPFTFPRLSDVTLENLPNLSSFYNGNCSLFWPSLDYLKIDNCPKMKAFISHSLSDQHILMRPLFDQQISFSALTQLYISDMPSVEQLFSPFAVKSFNVLAKLKIVDCSKLEEIILGEGSENDATDHIEFPMLQSIELDNLPQLESFYRRSCNFTFPQLYLLRVNNCPKLQKISSEIICKTVDNNLHSVFPVLEEFYLKDLNHLEEIWHGIYLKHLIVESCDRLKSIFTHRMVRDFSKLLRLTIRGCKTMEVVFEIKGEEDAKIKEYFAFPNLETLKLEDLPNLTCLYSNMNTSTLLDTLFAEEQDSLFSKLEDLDLENLPKLDRIFMDYVHSLQLVCFQNLLSVDIRKCNSMRNLFTWSMAHSLVQLEFLRIESCDLLDVIIVEDIQDDTSKAPFAFHPLTDVTLVNLPNLSSFYNGNCSLIWPSLWHIMIKGCPKMKAFISHSLSDQHILMRPLFDQQVSFSALTELSISYMPSVEYLFSPFVAKSFKVLGKLYIENCNKLEEIILGEGRGDDAMDHIEFPKLQYIYLDNLPHLESFYRGSCNFTCPKLNEMRVTKCPKMQKVSSGTISTPMLKSFEFNNSRYDLKDDLNSIIQHLFATKGEPQSQTNIGTVEQ